MVGILLFRPTTIQVMSDSEAKPDKGEQPN